MSTFLWDGGAESSGSLTKLSKRESYWNIKIDYPRLTLSALRMQDLAGTNEHNFKHWFTTLNVFSINIIHFNSFLPSFSLIVADRYLLVTVILVCMVCTSSVVVHKKITPRYFQIFTVARFTLNFGKQKDKKWKMTRIIDHIDHQASTTASSTT